MLNRKKIITICIVVLISIFAIIIIVLGYRYYKDYRIMSIRKQLFSELNTVTLENGAMKRFGDAHDGGYLLYDNLMQDVTSAYSYGIDGRDKWGCDISMRYNLVIHQYDCFNTTKPVCAGGKFVFHEECIGEKYLISDNKTFDSLKNQIIKNKDEKKKLVVKIDVEGAEWDSFLATPDEVLNTIDQLIVEFHGVDQEKYIKVFKKLRKIFYLVHVHFNNYACNDKIQPFPAWAYETLFVNKRIGKPDKTKSVSPRLAPLDNPNNPVNKDCQASQ
jgi:hypothetical protein